MNQITHFQLELKVVISQSTFEAWLMISIFWNKPDSSSVLTKLLKWSSKSIELEWTFPARRTTLRSSSSFRTTFLQDLCLSSYRLGFPALLEIQLIYNHFFWSVIAQNLFIASIRSKYSMS